MAHFFLPSHGSNDDSMLAVEHAGLTEVLIDRTHPTVKIGLWGGAADGSALTVKVHRNGTVVSEGRGAPVKIEPASRDAAHHVRIFNIRGLRSGDFIRAWDAAGTAQTQPLPTLELGEGPLDTMKAWGKAFLSNSPWVLAKGLCPIATPYLGLTHTKYGKMTALKASCVGGPMMNVHGLAVHSTAGNSNSTAFTMAAFRCVQTWNSRGTASAHFGISGDGTLVQFIPTSHVAYAQASTANLHWISVEVDNDGRQPMNALQMTALKQLFGWVTQVYGVPAKLATGCLFPKHKQFDDATSEVCTSTTENGYEAIMSAGLSCHWWLQPAKGPGSHACPGKGIIGQLGEVVGN